MHVQVDDAVLISGTEGNIKQLVESFEGACKCCCLKVYVGKSSVMIVARGGESVCNVQVDDEKLELLKRLLIKLDTQE